MKEEPVLKWWYKEGVQVINDPYQIQFDDFVINKPEARWRVKQSGLMKTAYGTFIRVCGQCLEVTKCKPDLDDPGTIGFLQEAVREAYNNKVVISRGCRWWCVETDEARWDNDNTKSFGEALVSALCCTP